MTASEDRAEQAHRSQTLSSPTLEYSPRVPESGQSRSSSYYWAPVGEFLMTSAEAVLGRLAASHSHDLELAQTRAWEEEIGILRDALTGVAGTLYLEFDVPRLGSRIDAVLVSGPAVFPIEFQCGERRFTVDAFNQAWDYALDLKNFHEGSHKAQIFPVLVATAAELGDPDWLPERPARG